MPGAGTQVTRVAGAPVARALRTALPWRAVVAPWLLSRILSVVVMLAAVQDPFRGGRFTQFVLKWDGAHYVGIARTGFGPVDVEFPRWAFFPGLPAVIRVLRFLGDEEVLVFALNQLAFLVALAGVYRIARRYGTGRAADLAVWSLALFPASFVFSMTYPSSLFLAASVWAFVLVDERHDLAAGVLAGGAALLRPNGIVVAASLVVAVRVLRRAAVVAAPAVVAVAAWCWYCQHRTGDALVWLTTKERWQEITFVSLFDDGAKWSVLPHGLLALAGIVLVIWQRRRLSVAFLVLTALLLVPSLVTGMVGLARYTNECFPVFVATGQVIERWSASVRIAFLAASGAGLVLFAFVVARYALVP